ncbi:MAG: GntR family transcriptional regulator [Rhodoferax sp.]|uniref:GntR family transcriptional regulator n=1 Tax=Rhodoferax sp. TaxID=50421 RepID=UPI0032652D13
MKISAQLREKIEDRIATGVLLPGSALDEASLAQLYGVSRTPVREAMIQLAAEGLIEMRPRHGAVVTRMDPTRLLEMCEVMVTLETLCGQLAARRMTNGERLALVTAHADCEKALADQDPEAYFGGTESFHTALYAGSHNRYLSDQAAKLQRRLRPYLRLQLRARNRMDTAFQEQTAILRGITAGDAQAATEALHQHAMLQGERFGDLLASLASLPLSAEA